MIQTRFLSVHEFNHYRQWLLERDSETLAMYFGIPTGEDVIHDLVDKILANPDEHYFLVALKGNEWVGVIHMARISETQMEFGVMVHEDHRHLGIADDMMREAITWIQNRKYDTLYLHCLNRNSAMKHLADKHGLVIYEDHGDIESRTSVPPPSALSYLNEVTNYQKNIFFMNIQNIWAPFSERHG
jgi:RimJ/RimL family protein N-acetyltransferase